MDDTDQLLPLCFVLMPFGKKMDAAARVTNFNSVYAKIPKTLRRGFIAAARRLPPLRRRSRQTA